MYSTLGSHLKNWPCGYLTKNTLPFHEKNSYDRILSREYKEQHLGIICKSCHFFLYVIIFVQDMKGVELYMWVPKKHF